MVKLPKLEWAEIDIVGKSELMRKDRWNRTSEIASQIEPRRSSRGRGQDDLSPAGLIESQLKKVQ